MKGMIASGISILLIIAFVFSCSFAIRKIFDSLSEEVEKISEDSKPKDLGNLKKYFEKSAPFLSIAINDSYLFEIETSINELANYIEDEKKDDFALEKSRLLSMLKEQKRLSGFNFKSIL